MTADATTRVAERKGLLEQARDLEARLAAAHANGDLGPLLPHLEAIGPRAVGLAPYLTTAQVTTLLTLTEPEDVVEAVIAAWVNQRSARGGGIARRRKLVLLTPGWPPRARIQLLNDQRSPRAAAELVRLAETDPQVAIFLGMHLSPVDHARLGQRVPKALWEKFEGNVWYRLGDVFHGGLSDMHLERDMIDLIASIEHPEVAVTLAATVVPRPAGQRDLEIARSLERLIHAVDGVMADPTQPVPA